MRSTRHLRSPYLWRAAIVAVGLALALRPVYSAQPAFLPDDPLQQEPDSQDASGVRSWDIALPYDLFHNFVTTARRKPSNVRAGNVNTIDEVPDSNWFTNRVGSRTLSAEELQNGPNTGPAPDPSTWTVIREKSSGFAAGFTARDARGETWFLSFDAPSNPEGATGAIVVATKLFWALGYHQVENHLSELRPEHVRIDPKATVRRRSGRRTPMTEDDVAAVLARATPGQDGAYRVTAGRLIAGRILGGFKYEGTRPDDPNDVVEHQHRRELRALRVFGAWTNLTDMKAGNTLDSLVTSDGRSVVRHYLQDVGSTFGVGAQGPHEWNEGWEYLFDGGPAMRRLFSLGFAFSRWQTIPYEELPAVGRFEGDAFDPATWKPHVPVRAYIEMRDDDGFWAARRVTAFSDDDIRVAVGAGGYSNPQASELLVRVLAKRRDRIGRHYLPRINPVVEPVLDAGGVLTFANAAVDHRVSSPPRAYTATWYAFDNATRASTRLAETSGPSARLTAPASLPAAIGTFVRVDIAASHDEHPSWRTPIETYFLRQASGWKLVGLVRQPGN